MKEPDLDARLADDLDGSFEALVLAMQGPIYRFACRWCGNAQGPPIGDADLFLLSSRSPSPRAAGLAHLADGRTGASGTLQSP